MVALVVSQELSRIWSFNSPWRCSPFFIRLDILTNFVEKYKEFFLYPRFLSTKPSLFFSNLTDWLDESLQCCCRTITHLRLKLFWSLVMFILLYSPWDPYKLCKKRKEFFFFLAEDLVQKAKFLKKIWPIDLTSLYSYVSHNSSFSSKAFLVIGNVHLALFTIIYL